MGLQAATDRIRMFSDADGSTPIDELDKLLQALAEGAGIVAQPAVVVMGRDPLREPKTGHDFVDEILSAWHPPAKRYNKEDAGSATATRVDTNGKTTGQ